MFPMIPGLLNPDGTVNPIMLGAALRVYRPQIDAFASSGKAPAHVVAAVNGLADAIDKWGTDTEAAQLEHAAQLGNGADRSSVVL